jgi:TonB family protein
MNHIVISEKDYEENGHNILLHEQAHIACCHSWDVLWLSLVEVLQWFNPFIWMLSKEMQDVHEYEADLCVLRKGINAKDYQLLIIQKAAGPSSSAFANGFNHSSLKKRITMMIKEKSNPWARAKYLYLLPVAAICMIACTQSPKSTDKAEPEVKVTEVEVEKEEVTEQTVFQVVEEMPEFPGGMQEMMKWLGANIKYPTICQENGTQGRVIVQFVVTREGDITDAAVAKGVDPYLDAEALRVIKSMPKWKPGKQRGKEVNVKYTLPVVFRLQ